MDDWFSAIASDCVLPADTAQELQDVGFLIIEGVVPALKLARLAAAYDEAVARADASDRNTGSTTTRVNDLVNRGREFDELYIYEPLLAACCSIIGRPFKLSSMLARTVNPYVRAQELHVDFRREQDGGWPMVGFIIMVDEFRSYNGATRFVPGSHMWATISSDLLESEPADHRQQILACAPAGSMIIYNGSIWHGHSANRTGELRRSIQGAYIRRDAEAAINQAARIRTETLARISPLAKYLLDV